MKRLFGCFILIFCLSFGLPVHAETSPEHVEAIERMTKDIEALLAANAELQRRLANTAEELNRLRQEQSRAANDNSAVQGIRDDLRNDLRKLAEKIQEVDQKRISDKSEIAKEVERSFERIEKLLKSNGGSSGSASVRSRPPVHDDPPTPSVPKEPIPSDGFEYTVKPGDYLTKIINAANVQLKQQGFKAVTLSQVQNANPGLVPNRMKVGDKVFIPAYK